MSKASCVPRQWLYKRYDFWEHYSQSEILFSDNLAAGSCCGIGRQFFGRSVPPWNSLGSEFEQYRDGEIFVPRTRTLFSWMRSPPRGPCESDIDCFAPLAPPLSAPLVAPCQCRVLASDCGQISLSKTGSNRPMTMSGCCFLSPFRPEIGHAACSYRYSTTVVSLVTSGFEHSPGYAHIGIAIHELFTRYLYLHHRPH